MTTAVQRVFLHPSNIAHIAGEVQRRLPQNTAVITKRGILPRMSQYLEAAPGYYTREQFGGDERRYMDAVLSHVDRLNERVVGDIVAQIGVDRGMQEYHLKSLAGTLEMAPRAMNSTPVGMNRKGDPVELSPLFF